MKDLIRKTKKNLLKDSVIFLGIFSVLFFLEIVGDYQDKKYENLDYYPLPKAKPIWERKVNLSQEIRIGAITDTHIRPTRINKEDDGESAQRIIKPEYLKVFKNFNGQMNSFQPDFIVHLGDLIEGTGDPDYVGLSGINLVKKELLKNNVPIFWVVGNHDLRSVSKDQFREVLGMDSLSYVRDWDGYRFIFLDANFNPNNRENDFIGEGYLPGFIHPEDMNWLEERLKTNKRVFVFMHQSAMDNMDTEVDLKQSIFNARELRNILEKYNAEAIFNGHIEVLHFMEKNGVEYYSLVGTKKNLKYPDSYYEITIKNNQVKADIFYLDPKTKKICRLILTENFELNKKICNY